MSDKSSPEQQETREETMKNVLRNLDDKPAQDLHNFLKGVDSGQHTCKDMKAEFPTSEAIAREFQLMDYKKPEHRKDKYPEPGDIAFVTPRGKNLI